MKALILAALLFGSLTACVPCFGQVHCISLDDSRWLHEQALKVVALDSVVNSQDRQITILERSAVQSFEKFERLLQIESDKFATQKEITANMEGLAMSYRDQMNYYQQQDRKHRRQNKLLAGLVILIAGLAIVK